MIFWDDSGAHNDDDHDDYVAIARFTGSVVDLLNPLSDIPGDDPPGGNETNLVSLTQVPEPATGLLLAGGLAALGLSRRLRGISPGALDLPPIERPGDSFRARPLARGRRSSSPQGFRYCTSCPETRVSSPSAGRTMATHG
jgi:hypothetical protein